jgi:sarcosine oxidase subunit alpha
MAGSRPVYDEALAAFLPGKPREAWISCGAASGVFALADCLADGARAGAEAARRAGFDAAAAPVPTSAERPKSAGVRPIWEVPAPQGRKVRKFVDLQHDVTADDVALAHREGYVSVEHLKRYTTQGMATDQGKTGNIGALALMAALRGEPIPAVGTTTFRPPYTPVAIGALAGREVGGHFRPTRLTPMHDWHIAHGAEMITVGPWLRPRIYAKPGETIEQAYVREARAVRAGVGMVDVSTLGKIDVLGPDAAEFLNRVYVNGFKKLPVGKARYGIMLREDGVMFDDGTVWRLDEHRFLMTTTTANAAPVLLHLERLLQVAWPDLRVTVTSVTEQWAGMAVSGPDGRKTLAKVVDDIDVSDAALPFMGVARGHVGGIPVLIARLSFSGEMAYEVYAAADHGTTVWERILHAGADFAIVPYGTEALGTLRIEKGHVAGPELDGRTTLHDIGFERMAAKNKHYVGKALMNREGLTDPNRPRYVGLLSGTGHAIRAGAHLVEGSEASNPGPSLGHVSSTTYSPALERYIALGFVRDGKERIGQTLYAADPVRGGHDAVEVVDPVFFDPGGERMHG